jgi:hypothetical protein
LLFTGTNPLTVVFGGTSTGTLPTAPSLTVTPLQSGDYGIASAIGGLINTQTPWSAVFGGDTYESYLFTSSSSSTARWLDTGTSGTVWTTAAIIVTESTPHTASAIGTFSATASAGIILPPGGTVVSQFVGAGSGALSTAVGFANVAGQFSASAVGQVPYNPGAQIPSLPTLSVQIAFNPTNITSTTQTWTDVTQFVRDFTTSSGKQHYLDRVEAATLQITFDNRTGFFLNAATNGTGYVLQPRCPIKITATWNGTAYPIYYGLIDQISENVADQLNYDLAVQASDLTKYLSLKYLLNPAFWAQYAKSSSASAWLRCDNSQIYTVTGATSTGLSITYQCVNNFSVGQIITVAGLTTATGASLNVNNAQVTSATSNTFTVNVAVTGTASGTGTAYNTALTDLIGGTTARYDGVVSFPNNGAVIYDANGCVDLANGSGSATGYIDLSSVMGSGSYGALDFWIITQTPTQATSRSLRVERTTSFTSSWPPTATSRFRPPPKPRQERLFTQPTPASRSQTATGTT